MDDFDCTLKQKREELRKLLLGGALYIDEDKCEKDYQKNFQVKEEQTRKTTT